jgi:hypothetical protein
LYSFLKQGKLNMEKRIFWSVLILAGVLTGSALAAERPTYTCYRLAKAPVIDGDLSDWPGLPVIFLGRQEQVSTGEWKGPKDCYGTVRMGWDDRALYFAIEVTDDEVIQNLSDENAGLIYQQDSIQWGIDIGGKGGVGYDGDDYEYGFGKTTSGPCVYRWQVSRSGLVPGRTTQVNLAVKKTAAGLVYEAAVPYEQLLPLRPVPGLKVGFTILIQDKDESSKKTMEWTPGISCGKTPGHFGLLEFSDAAATAGSGGIFISGQTEVDITPVSYQVIAPEMTGSGTLLWELADSKGIVKAGGKVEGEKRFSFTVAPRKLEPGTYTILCKITGKEIRNPLTTKMAIERFDIESGSKLRSTMNDRMGQLKQMITEAKAKKIETAYAQGVLAVAQIFQPFIDEDIKKDRKVLALRNIKAIDQALDRQIKNGFADLTGFNKVPRPDMSKIVIKDGEFYAGGEPVIMVGPMAWLWEIHTWRDKFGPMGFNTLRMGMEPATLYDDKGKLLKDIPWWALTDCIRAAKSQNLAIGTTTPLANQVWTSLLRAGPVSMERFREEYKTFTRLAMDRIGRGNCFYHEISVESWRPPIEEVKGIPDRFDQIMRSKELVAEELKRCVAVVRKEDPKAIVGGYPSLLMMDDESDFTGTLDPELDLSAYDVCDADTTGEYASGRFAMDTLHWLAMFRDWMGGLAPGKPQWDGEFHFVNERRAYSEEWVRAIHFQGYIHGMSGTFSWAWSRSDTLDSAILLEAQVALEYSRTALDLRRLAGPIIAFHKAEPQVAILYSHCSTPYQHLRQMQRVYEGLFFEGIKVTFVSDRQAEQGRLKGFKPRLLIVPAASHVSNKAVEQIKRFADNGGTVLLVGNCFKFDQRGKLREKKVGLERMEPIKAFDTAGEARTSLKPWLEKLGGVPPVKVETTGNSFPVLEWRYAKDGKDDLVYLLNLGHKPVTVTLWLAGKKRDGRDLISGEKFGPTGVMKSLDVRIIKY